MTLRAAIFVLNLVSAVMTALGFFPLFGSYLASVLPSEVANYTAAAIAGTMSIAIQALVHAFWWRAGIERTLLLGVTAGLAASILSWVGSAGGFQMMFGQQTMLEAREQVSAAATAQPLRDFASGFADLQAEFAGVADFLQRKAEDEQSGRPTCANDTSTGAICGARCRLRIEHSRQIAAHETEAMSLAHDARELSLAMTLATDLAARQDIYAEAVRLQGNSTQPALAMALRAIAADYGRELLDANGRPFLCEDPETVGRLMELADRVEVRFSLPDIAPQAQRVEFSDTLTCVGARLAQLLGFGAGCAEASPDAAMMTAAAIEIVLALLILFEARRRLRYGGAPSWVEVALDTMGAADRKRLDRLTPWLDRVGLFLLDAPPMGRFFAQPVDGDAAAQAEAAALVRVLRLGRPRYARVPLAETDPAWVHGRFDAFGGAQVFDLHAWTPEAESLADRARIHALLEPGRSTDLGRSTWGNDAG